MATDRSASAFAPGHVTAFFAPHRHDDPERAGSVGAGIALSDGVHAVVRPTARTTVSLNGDDEPPGAVLNVLETMDISATVRLKTPLPIGSGFGVSGAAALATAIAANGVVAAEDPAAARMENELTTIAHVADVEAGTGLGDVVAQARGGVPIRTSPGAPGNGTIDGLPATGRLEYLALGELSTPAVLGGDTAAIETAGDAALQRLQAQPTLGKLFSVARTFAADADLLTDDVATVLDDVDQALGDEAPAAMAMLGRSVIAMGTALTDAGYEPSVARIHGGGATIVEHPESLSGSTANEQP